jgi:hypothetical protein
MSPDEALIHRLEAADTQELARLLVSASADEERVLRVYLGEDRFRRMRALATRPGQRGLRGPAGNVVVIHGIMGAELTARKGTDDDLVWVNLFRIAFGSLSRLQLQPDGETDVGPWVVRASGILKKYYGELLLSLGGAWNVKPFFFDWRKGLDAAAAALDARLGEWFGDGAPVHLVAHSMGGLVARTFIANHGARWRSMWDRAGKGRAGGRLIMLGTPNQGSFAIPQVLMGIEPLVQQLKVVDLSHDMPGLRRIFNTFPGSLQMLPSPFVYDSLTPLYQSATYGALGIPQVHLDAARAHHQKLRPIVDPDRMLYVAGYDQPTYSYVDPTFPRMANLKAYAVTRAGDGRVPHVLGLLKDVTSYFLPLDHGALSMDRQVFELLPDLLQDGGSNRAPTALPNARKVASAAEERQLRAALEKRAADDAAALSALMTRERTRRLGPTGEPPPLEPGDRQAEELILRGFLGTGPTDGATRPGATGASPANLPVRLQVRVVLGAIQDSDTLAEAPDALAVGHYLGVAPQAAEKAVDELLSAGDPPGVRGVLAELSERGILRGALGQPFFLPDPRARGGRPRLVAVAGLGEPGRLGVPELTVVVRELCWSLGRLGRRHLATVLIGAGAGNLSVSEAMSAWMRGARRALAGAEPGRALARLTFVERDPARVGELVEALRAQRQAQRGQNFEIVLEEPPASERRQWERARLADCLARCRDDAQAEPTSAPAPTVVTVTRENDGLRFSALTESAAIPERAIIVDEALVMEVNRQLAGAADPASQRRYGQFLHKLVVPEDLRGHFQSPAPLVLLLDADTARLHWEMLAEPDAADEAAGSDGFLGTTRGLTRRLRTTFAGPPEPPPPRGRVLRVLVVADPAQEARLPGAAREGMEVADLFESFGREDGNQVEVTRLFGPQEANRLDVLLALTERPFDVLHFAGHCFFDEENPPASGWIFSGGARITARELTRIDRVPPFVFSNACESGITPERAAGRGRSAPASFAEEFFARGVSNFVCTAWEIDDAAARAFALRIYRELLGLGAERGRYATMAQALQAARMELFDPSGSRTWGAYQHYGSPAYRFFEPSPPAHRQERTLSARKRSRGRRAKPRPS